MKRFPQFIAYAAYFLVAAIISTGVYFQSLNDSLSQIEVRAKVRLEQYNDRLLGQISRFQQLVNSLSQRPEMDTIVAGAAPTDIKDLLLSFALSTGADAVLVLDNLGMVLASSDYIDETKPGRVGQRLGNAHHVKLALDGGLGVSHAIDQSSDPRALYFSRAIFGQDGPVIGAVTVAVRVSALEFEWSFGPDPVIYYDQAGLAFISNRPELALQRDQTQGFANSQPISYELSSFENGFTTDTYKVVGHQLWQISGTDELPPTAMLLSTHLPRLKLKGVIFQDVGSAIERAWLFTSLSALAAALLGMGLWLAWRRRQDLARQLLLEAATSERLEARVGQRTRELNETQRQLIAASRLTALGEMSAGISHELNQPLAAIRQYAENGQKYLERARPYDAGKNFGLQIEQVDRIGRIIKSLRAFARNEEQDIRSVDLKITVEAALALSESRLKNSSVCVSTNGLEKPLQVQAGQVRLQQVIINILGNAIDALEDCDDKSIDIIAKPSGSSVILTITDNGPGVADPDRVFDPFYSTKAVGSSSGMGLGLSISHGIIESFGGSLKCENLGNDLGARFLISLPASEEVI